MIAVVSPHLDDGALGCGARLAAERGSVVITVLAAGPASWETVTPWDEACGFSAGDDVIAARRAEDLEALGLLGATPVWLDFQDAQYAPPPSGQALFEALEATLAALPAGAVFLPLGLHHSDHVLVSEAALSVARAARRRADPAAAQRTFHLYEDAVYRRIPGLTEGALDRTRARGFHVSPEPFTAEATCLEQKRRAVSRYRSQLRGLTAGGRAGYDDAFEPERYWRLSP